MRFMIRVKASADSEAGVMLAEAFFKTMGGYREALAKGRRAGRRKRSAADLVWLAHHLIRRPQNRDRRPIGRDKGARRRLHQEIDERVAAFMGRPLEGDWPYLWLDATDVKVRHNGRVVSVAVVLAIGVTAFAQPDAASAKIQWRQVADQMRPKLPKLAAIMDEAEDDVLAYMTFPKAHWPKLHSTNPIERLNGAIKRRADVVGIFPNEAAIKRLAGAILMEQNDEWAVQRCRYMTQETMTTVSEDTAPMLAAVAS